MEKMKKCKACGKEIASNAKICPNCGAKNKKPFYKTAWFWIVIVIVLIIAAGSNTDSTENKYEKNKNNKITVVDFANMTEAERDNWCTKNKVNCDTKNEYSDSIPKDKLISQSIEPNKVIYEGENLVITISLGKKPTNGEKNALEKAKSYSNTMNMSKKGIYNQLTSSIEGFTEEEAQYAIDNIKADWNKNALEKAKSYQKSMNMSKKAIYNQLTSSFEGFTEEEAQYAIDHLED